MNSAPQCSLFYDSPHNSGEVDEIAAWDQKLFPTSSYSLQQWRETLKQEQNHLFLIKHQRSAPSSWSGVALFQHVVDDQVVHLLKIFILPNFQRQGLAKQLLTSPFIRSYFEKRGGHCCYLEVEESNHGARSFYQSLNFHTLNFRPNFYSNGSGAYMMSKNLPISAA